MLPFQLASYPKLHTVYSQSQSANGKPLIEGYVAVTIPGDYHNHAEMAHVYKAITLLENYNHDGNFYNTKYEYKGDIRINPNDESFLFGIMDSKSLEKKINNPGAGCGVDIYNCTKELDQRLPEIIQDFLKFNPYNGAAKPLMTAAMLYAAVQGIKKYLGS